ncbi:unnamed protein product, partial [Iphiclides podalirius]
MSVAQGLVASSSQAKGEIVIEVPKYEMNCAQPKETESIEMELKIAYVNPSSGHVCSPATAVQWRLHALVTTY